MVMIGIYLAGFLLRGLRWHYMLLPIKDIRPRATTECVIVGYMANNIFPARAGEVIRAVILGSRESISKASTLGTIAVERLFDGLVILGILVLCSFFLGEGDARGGFLPPVIYLGTAIFGGASIFVVFGYFQSGRIQKFVNSLSRHFPPRLGQKMNIVSRGVLESLGCLRFTRHLHFVVILSILIWAVEGLVFWVGLIAFGLGTSLLTSYFALALVNLAMLIPSAPGGVGVFQQGNILAFSLFGISAERAFSYSVVVQGAMIVPITLLGLIILSRYGLSILKMGGRNWSPALTPK